MTISFQKESVILLNYYDQSWTFSSKNEFLNAYIDHLIFTHISYFYSIYLHKQQKKILLFLAKTLVKIYMKKLIKATSIV
jgi:hypothetical protein